MTVMDYKQALCRCIHMLHNKLGVPFEDPILRNLLKINYEDNLLMSSANFAEFRRRREQSAGYVESFYNDLFKPEDYVAVVNTA